VTLRPAQGSGQSQVIGSYRYIKFVIESANKAGGLSEIEVYESTGSLSFINTVGNYFANIWSSNVDTALAEEPVVVNSVDPTKLYNYDKNGNLLTDGTRIFVYDAFNRMVKVLNRANNSEIAKYGYDAFGNRVLKTVDNITTRYVYSGKQVIEEYTNDEFSKSYIYGVQGLDDVIRMEKASGDEYYYHKDILGSVIALSNNDGEVVEKYEYDPYENTEIRNPNNEVISASTVGNDFQYTGQRADSETGLYYYKARFYSPTLGRFLNQDPIGYKDSMNLYQYVGGNPVNYVDPLGLYKEGSQGNMSSGMSGWLSSFIDTAYAAENVGVSSTGECVGFTCALVGYSIGLVKSPFEVLGASLAGYLGIASVISGQEKLNIGNLPENVANIIGGIIGSIANFHNLSDSDKGEALGSLVGQTVIYGGLYSKFTSILKKYVGSDGISKTLERIDRGEKYPHRNDGTIFQNRPVNGKSLLPEKPLGYYKEYVHPTDGRTGLQRIVKGEGGDIYYTPDHYKSFFNIKK